MITIGLTGGSGTGKTLVSQRFAQLGAHVLDADAIYAQLCREHQQMRQEIADAFGADVLTDEGIDRKKLAAMVFSDKKKLGTLNGITHVYVTDAVIRQLQQLRERGAQVAVYDAPLLLESHGDQFCQAVVGVVAPMEERLNRICKRDGISRKAAFERIENQPPELFYWQRCQYIIENDGTEQALYRKCDYIYRVLTQKGEK